MHRKRVTTALLWGAATLVLALLMAGCDGGESSSSIAQAGSTPKEEVQLPKPTNPSDPDEWAHEEEETVRYSQITSASGSTPPPPPVIVR